LFDADGPLVFQDACKETATPFADKAMRVLRTMIVILAAIAASAVYFRAPVLSGFDALPCDKWDGSLIFGIVDHWRLVFSGERGWQNLQMFWPASHTIGYSDTFFIPGVLYAMLCKCGVDPYYAFTAVFMTLAACGFVLMHLLLRRFLRLPFALSLAVAFLFVNLSPIALAGTHLQLTFAWLLPGLLILALKTAENGRRASLWAAAFAAALALMFFTAFYVPWFFTFYLCILAAVWLAVQRVSGRKSREILRDLGREIAARKMPLAVFAATFLIALTPFFMAYLPALNSGGAWSYKGMARALPSALDYVNVGGANGVWGWLFGAGLDSRDYAFELHFGLPLVTFAAFLFATAWYFSARVRGNPLSPVAGVALCVGLAVVACWGILLRFGGWSLWSVVHALVPGAGAIRAAFRFNVVLSFFALLVIALLLKELFEAKVRVAKTLACFVLAAMFAEQFSRADLSASLRRSEDMRFMQSVPPPDVRTRPFFVTSSQLSNVGAQVAAFRIAQKFGLETVNGFSGSAPRSYLPRDVHSADYINNINGWLDFEYTSFECLNLDTLQWSVVDWGVYGGYKLGGDIVAQSKFSAFSLYNAGGWSKQEVSGVWSDGKFARIVLIIRDKNFAGRKRLDMECSAFLPKGTPVQTAVIHVNGRTLGTICMTKAGEVRRFSFILPADCNDSAKLVFSFEIPKARSPASRGLWNDTRLLGIELKSFVVGPAGTNLEK
jgi:hypothetical protein